MIHFFRNLFMVLSITVKVLRPKRSNLTSPAFSDEYISYCVEGKIKFEVWSMYNGNCSANISPAITTPAACVAIFLFKPSNFKDSSRSFFTFEMSSAPKIIIRIYF